MSIIPLSIDNFENYSIRTHTHRVFSSSSSGLLGDISIFPRGSEIEKDLVPPGDNSGDPAGKKTVYDVWEDMVRLDSETPLTDRVSRYLDTVSAEEPSRAKQKRVSVIRFEPSFRFTKDTCRKNTVKNILFPYYANKYDSSDWSFPNYHSINFFTSSAVPTESALIYPAPGGRYTPSEAFTIQFWINPRYTTDNREEEYTAGTVLHLSSTFAVSLVSGSSVDADGNPDAFRILLQLGHSAGIPPSKISLDSPRGPAIDDVPSDLIFLTSDNCIKRNHWHHVTVRWGGLQVNAGSGSFVIDGILDENFCIPSASIMPQPPFGFPNISDPSGLFVGNFFEQKSEAGLVSRFFNANTAYAEGLESFFPSVPPNGLDLVDIKIVRPAGLNTSVNLSASITFKDVPFYGTSFLFNYGPTGSPILSNIDFVEGVPLANEISVDGLASNLQAASAFADKVNNLLTGFFTATAKENVVNITGFREPDGIIDPIRPTIEHTEPGSSIDENDPTISDPPDSSFDLLHPLNAEIHEIRIFNSYKDIETIRYTSSGSLGAISEDLLFYLPPFFTSATPERNVLQTPFQSVMTTTNDPFNVALSFGIGAREINLPNFLKELVAGSYPRLYNLKAQETAVAIDEARSANDIMYDQAAFRKANLTVLPNDNGLFRPRYNILASTGESAVGFKALSNGLADYSRISLDDMVDLSNISMGSPSDDDTGGHLIDEVATPEDPGLSPGNILTILNRTRDPSSNEVVFFDASNLFYGNSIKNRSYTITDPNLTGSGDKISFTMKDNGRGGLYRADCLTAHSTWNEIGTILYDEGISVIKSPNVPFFGKDKWEVEFDGDYNVYVLEVNVPCAKGQFSSSSNPNWVSLRANDSANLVDENFSYVTGMNLHDENFNVIARMNLAQPVVKKESDKFLFRAKIDF